LLHVRKLGYSNNHTQTAKPEWRGNAGKARQKRRFVFTLIAITPTQPLVNAMPPYSLINIG
jgi:hypothetical protein